jgi:hypothetical protein
MNKQEFFGGNRIKHAIKYHTDRQGKPKGQRGHRLVAWSIKREANTRDREVFILGQ